MRVNSLRSKVNVYIFITSAVIAIVFGAILYPFERDRYEADLKNIHLLLDSVLGQRMEDLANELYADQRRALQASLAEICKVEGIAAVSVQLPDGHIYATSNEQLARQFPVSDRLSTGSNDVSETISHDGKSLLVLTKPVDVIGMHVGQVRIYYDLSSLNDEILLSSVFFVALLLTVILVMSLLLNLILSQLVLQPVSALQCAIRKIEEGQLGEMVEMDSNDEIGAVGNAFNEMSSKLAGSQSALKDTEEKYRGIFENAIEGIFQSTPEGERFLTVNPSMAKILGYDSPEDMLSRIDDIAGGLYVNPDHRSELHLLLQRDGHVIGYETQMFRKDKSVVWVSISARSVRDESGRVVHYEGSLIDITVRREKERAEREREAAQAASKAKGEFLANMSHEIRTPMNAILGFTDLLASIVSDPMQKYYLESIEVSSRGLMALINNILDLSKIEAGKMEIRQERVNLRFMAEEVSRVFSAQLSTKGIDLLTTISPLLPEALILDETRLRQVLLNLVGNAIKFTDSGVITLSVEGEPLNTDPRRANLKITVEDTGIGIQPEAQDEVFDSFAQLQGEGSCTQGGTGLGLAISKSLVEMMGGEISVRSVPGQGSTFEIQLPDTCIGDPDHPVHPSDETFHTEFLLGKATVLVADDLRLNRVLLKQFLRGDDITIIEAENGLTALELARSCRPDLILMDIKMPVMDGYTAIGELRRDRVTRSIPVIALTAVGMKEERDRILASGFDSLLIRPFERLEFYSVVARFLGRTSELSPKKSGPSSENIVGETPSQAFLAESNYVLRRLKTDLTADWLAAKEKQNIPDIESFARHIKDLGDQYSTLSLSSYGESLLFRVNGFDIDNIMASLAYYPELVAKIEELGQSHG